jgi:hypothetical protein
VPLQRWDRLAEKAVRYSLLMSPEVIAIHLTKLEGPDAEEHVGRLRGNGDRKSNSPRRVPD